AREVLAVAGHDDQLVRDCQRSRPTVCLTDSFDRGRPGLIQCLCLIVVREDVEAGEVTNDVCQSRVEESQAQAGPGAVRVDRRQAALQHLFDSDAANAEVFVGYAQDALVEAWMASQCEGRRVVVEEVLHLFGRVSLGAETADFFEHELPGWVISERAKRTGERVFVCRSLGACRKLDWIGRGNAGPPCYFSLRCFLAWCHSVSYDLCRRFDPWPHSTT